MGWFDARACQRTNHGFESGHVKDSSQVDKVWARFLYAGEDVFRTPDLLCPYFTEDEETFALARENLGVRQVGSLQRAIWMTMIRRIFRSEPLFVNKLWDWLARTTSERAYLHAELVDLVKPTQLEGRLQLLRRYGTGQHWC